MCEVLAVVNTGRGHTTSHAETSHRGGLADPRAQVNDRRMISPATGAAGSRIVGLGHHQPAKVLTNDDVAQLVETNDEWIRSRTGIVTRHVADESTTVADMAVAPARHALEDAGVAAPDADPVIVAPAPAVDRPPNPPRRGP